MLAQIIAAIPVGLLVGVLARLIIPGRQDIGNFLTLVIGVASALLGTGASRLLSLSDTWMDSLWGLEWSWATLLIQVLFATIGVAVAAAIARTRVNTDTPSRRRTRTSRTRTARAR